MAKTLQELQSLEEPQSRIEKYFNVISGRSTDINSLPEPQSRIEEYLEYVALNTLNAINNSTSNLNASNIQFTDNINLSATNIDEAIRNLNTKINDNDASCVKLDSNKIVNEEIIIKNGFVGNGLIAIYNNSNPDMAVSNQNACFSSKELLVPANTFVEKIMLMVDDTLNVGDIVTDVKVGAISKSSDVILDYIVNGQTAIVHGNNGTQLTGNRAITINVNHSWTEDVYLIVGANRMLWRSRIESEQNHSAWGYDTPPAPDEHAHWSNQGTYVGRAMAYSNIVNFKKFITDFSFSNNELTFMRGDNTTKTINLETGLLVKDWS